MNVIARRAIKSAALVSTAASALSVLAYFGALPDFTPWYSVVTDNTLIILLGSTFLAAGLLAISLRGWSRIVAVVAFAPAAAAFGLMVFFRLLPSVESEWFGVTAFLLVEVAPPLEALLVVVAATALVIQETRLFVTSRLRQAGSS